MQRLKSQRGAIDLILILVVVIAAMAFGGYVYYQQRQAQQAYDAAGNGVTVSKHTAKPKDPYAGWKTYTSKVEKASFKYPSNWTLTSDVQQSNIPGVDVTGVISPSGSVKVTWMSAIDGLGGACDDQAALGKAGACPQIQYISQTPMTNASALVFVEAIVSTDGTTYMPWIGVLDTPVKLTTVRDANYAEFTGKHNGAFLNSQNTTAAFNTGGIYMSGPKLSQSAANAWFKGAEQQQAKLILESLSYN